MSDKQLVLKQTETNGENLGRQKPKKVALEEDNFTEAMKKIIRRDFFPDVHKLEAQLAYIEASENNDLEKLREISERYATDLVQTPSINGTPSRTPSTWRTEKNGGGEGEEQPPPPKKNKPEDSKSLDSFLHTYHSEDDAAFDEIMEREEAKRKEKYAWMYEREALAESLNRPAITSGTEDRNRLESGEEKLAITDGGNSTDKHGEVKMWKYTAKNSLMYVPDGVELTAEERASRGRGREIKHSNTRLSREFLKNMAAAGASSDQGGEGQDRQAQLKKEKIGIDGKELGVLESPKVQGYGFVATPQINPGVDASPLMTWGTIDGTPLHIDTDVVSTPGPVFKIPKESVRDGIGLKLASKASKSQRVRKKAAMAQATSTILGKSPTVRSSGGSTSERLLMLSPAARRLVRHSTTPGTLRGDKSLRASYGTPTRTSSSSLSRTPGHTPERYGNTTPSPRTPSLTDNLLNLK